MRRIRVAAALLVPALLTQSVGCSQLPAIAPSDVSSVLSKVDAFIQMILTALNFAQTAWSVVQLFIPASSLASATELYAKTLAAAQDSIVALRAGEDAIRQGTQPGGDINQLMADVTNTVQQVINVIDTFQSQAAQPTVRGAAVPPATIPGLKQAHDHLAAARAIADTTPHAIASPVSNR